MSLLLCSGVTASPKCFGTAPVMYTATKFCMMIKLDERKNFARSTMPVAVVKQIVTRMLTHDLLAVANLLDCLI